jgi:hypothetical protein
MALRSIHFAIAALLLVPVFLPAGTALTASAAFAEEAPAAEPQAGDSTPLSKLGRKDIRNRIKALREQIKKGDLTKPERRELRTKIKAYRQELKSRKQGGMGEEASPAHKGKGRTPGNKAAPEPPSAEKGTPTKPEPPSAEKGTPTKPEPPSAEKGTPTKTEGQEQAPAPEEAKTPQTDSGGEPTAKVSETDCTSRWNEANSNGDDVLTEDEAKPFVEALKPDGPMANGGDTGSGPTISKPEFMKACTNGAFKDMSH